MSEDRITVKLEPETKEERAKLLAALGATPAAEPLPIWFFVGLILLVYGVIVTVSGLVMDVRPTVLAETRPALWWGGGMCLGGAIFLGIGIKAARRSP